MSNPNAS